MRVRACWSLPMAALLLAGCAPVLVTVMEVEDSLSRVPIWTDSYWGWSVPIVKPGSPVFYVERAWGATKGMVNVTRQTVFIRFDLATCRKTGEKKFSGSAEVDGWGALPGEIWFRAENDKNLLHSFDGATRASAAPAHGPIDAIDRVGLEGRPSPSGRFVARSTEPDEITVIEASGRPVVRRQFGASVTPTRWSADEAHVFVFHYDSPNSRWWSLGVPNGEAIELPTEAWSSSPRFVEIGDTLFYAEGPAETPHLAAVNLSTGQRWAVTQPLRHIDALIAEPQARKLILTVDTTQVLTYDLAKASLTACKF